MRWLRRPKNHPVVVYEVDSEHYWPLCQGCAWNPEPQPTPKKAFAAARRHSANVAPDVQVFTEEGGVGWLCFFCGESIDASPVRMLLDWTENGANQEQMCCAHRKCLIQHASDDFPGGGPLFDV